MTVETFTPNAGVALAAPTVVDVTSAGLERLREWVAAAQHAHQLVAPLVGTPFVPASYKPKVDPRATDQEKREAYDTAVATATAAVLQGISVGLDPLTALQQIYVVHGRPGMYAKIKVALVQAKGHDVWTEDNTGTRAVVAGRRKGSQQIERVTITMDMARSAGWTKNDTYAKTPADMLWARAASRVCDRIASDVLNGIQSVEEIEDDHAAPAPTRSVRRSVASQPAAPALPAAAPMRPVTLTSPAPDRIPMPSPPVGQPAPTGLPPLPGEEPAADDARQVAPGGPPQIDKAAWDRINARFVELDVRGPGQTASRLAVIAEIIGRDIARGGELTATEGQLVLDVLAGGAGHTVVHQVLGQDETEDEPDATAQAADEQDGDLAYPPADDDPTLADGWPMDGAEAAGEGL